MSIAFWISPSGTYHEIETTHIQYVIDHPDLFNLSIDHIKNLYKKYNEPLPIEGKAREEIIRKVIREQGWIRIRHYLKPLDYWKFQVKDFNEDKGRIIQFCNEMIEKEIMGRNDSVKISDENREYIFDWKNEGVNKLVQNNPVK